MKSSASIKLLGRGSGVTPSCLAFELLKRPARKHLGQLLGYEVRLEAALQLSSVIKKRGYLPGGRAGLITAKGCDDEQSVEV